LEFGVSTNKSEEEAMGMSRLFGSLVVLWCVVLAAPVLSSGAINQIELQGLSEAQKADLVKQAETMREQGKGVPTAEKVEQWAILGERIGKALGGAAKELGIAANEFATTPLGVLTVVIVTWKLIGFDILQLIIGVMWLAVLIPIWLKYFRRLCLVESVSYAEDGKTIREIAYWKDGTSEERSALTTRRACMFFILLAFVGIGFLVMFA
jgi:hypothetical protein